MSRWIVTALAAVLTLSQVSWSLEFKAKAVSGAVLVYQNSSSEWYTIPDSMSIDVGDSLFVDQGHSGIAMLGDGCELVMSGPCRLSLGGQASAPVVHLKQGEMIFKRTEGAEASMVTITARGAVLTPMGTVAAVKFTKLGEPTVAVIRGKMRMQSNSGQAIIVDEGAFGTLDVNSAFKQGRLSPTAMRSLEQVAGLSENGPAPVAQSDEVLANEGEDPESPDQTPENNQMVENAVEAETVGKSTDMPQVMQTAAAVDQGSSMPGDSDDEAENQQETTPAGQPNDTRETTQNETAQVESDDAPAAGEKEEQDEQQEKKKEKKKSMSKRSTVGSGASVNDATGESIGEDQGQTAEESADAGAENEASGPSQPTYSMSAGPVTVDDAQWTRIAFMVDVPIWKFGIGLDVELFMNSQGQFDSKGWEFDEDSWVETLTRKIRYIRFAHEHDPLFAKLGALDNVTLSHGLIVDRFRNTLYYPDEKLLGMQFYLNDISPIGFTLQTMTGDLAEFRSEWKGGVAAARAAIKPLKMTGMPLLGNLDVGALYAIDRNQYAPARDWDLTLPEDRWDRDGDGITDSSFLYSKYGNEPYFDDLRQDAIAEKDYDTIIEHEPTKYQSYVDGFAILGFDATLPIITTDFLGFDLYGQYGINMDPEDKNDSTPTKGWGIGAPGVALRVGPIAASLEYRHTEENFDPGYFGPYYYENRLEFENVNGDSIPVTKEDSIQAANLNGLYGRLSFNISNILVISGTYQGLIGEKQADDARAPLDQRFEATATFGEMLISKIPRVNRAEAYIWKTEIMRTWIPERGEYDQFLTPTPNMFYGYRVGFEIMQGAGLVWDSRYTFEFDQDGKPRQKVHNVGIQASLTF